MGEEVNPVLAHRRGLDMSQRAASKAARVERNAFRAAEQDQKVTWPIITALAAWMQVDAKGLESQLAARRQVVSEAGE